MSGGRFVMPKDVRENALVRRRLLDDARRVPGAAAAMKAACAEDILFYVNAFCWTYDPRLEGSKVVPFVTYPYQDDALVKMLRCVEEGRDAAIEKSRDMGATWLIMVLAEYVWHFRKMTSSLVVSRNEDYVDAPGDPKSLFWKIDFLHDHQPKWLMPRGVSRRSMHLDSSDTGSIIDGESTTGDVGRGDRRTFMVLDEFAAFETAAGFNALKSSRDVTKCRLFNSTPKGSANAFFEVIHKTSAQIIDMHWSLHPEKNRGLYRSVKGERGKMQLELQSDWRGMVEVAEKGSRVVKCVAFPEDYPFILDGKTRSPWYDRECSRAVSSAEIAQELDIDFIGSDYQFFDQTAIHAYIDRWCMEPDSAGDFEIDSEMCSVIRYTRNVKGRFVFFEPLGRDDRVDRERRFVIGVDVAAGTGASDSTMECYDAKTREKVFDYANPSILPDDFGRLVVAVARYFNDATVVPDRSGPTGETMVRRMMNSGYGNIYRRRNVRKVGAPVTDEPGVYLNPSMRATILYQYRDAIGQASIINRSQVAMEETLKFICKVDGSVEHSAAANTNDPSGARANHGDRVIGDALAWLGLSEIGVAESSGESEPPTDSVAWRMREAERELERRRAGRRLGEEWSPQRLGNEWRNA